MEIGDLAAAASTLPVENPDAVPLSELVLSDHDSTSDSEYEHDVDDAQRQWDQNLANLENTLYLILCPMIGKVIGRRIAQNIWFNFVDFRWGRFKQRQLAQK